MSTPHWYQESSQATVIRTSLETPAAVPTETHGPPSVRARPAIITDSSLLLKRSIASSIRDIRLSAGEGERPIPAPGAAGSGLRRGAGGGGAGAGLGSTAAAGA